MLALQALLGYLIFLSIAFLLSENRTAIRFKVVFFGCLVQVLLALGLSQLSWIVKAFNLINTGILALNQACLKGTAFVFGFVGGAQPPFQALPGSSTFSLAFQAMPLVIVISALSSILFYLRVLPVMIKGISWALRKSLGLGGALATAVSANLFIGMAESPLVIRPYLRQLTRSELFTLMTCGMAGVAGTVMGLYVMMLSAKISLVMDHVISAVLINIPAVVVVSRIMVPETRAVTAGQDMHVESSTNFIEALIKGVRVGGEVFVSIIAMLLTLVALVDFLDQMLQFLPNLLGSPMSLERLLGFGFAPLVWLMGIPWHEAQIAGQLMGARLVLNELVSYGQLAALPSGALDARVQVMMLYAMCGFANLSGLGIMLSVYHVLIPERRKEFLSLGFKALLAGTLCSMMTATLVGLIDFVH